MTTTFTAQPRGSRRRRAASRVSTVALVLGLLLSAGVTVDLARDANASQGRLLPGTTIGGHEVGGLTPDEARARLTAAYRPHLTRTVAVRLDGRTWTRSAGDLGVTTDLEAQLATAVAAAEVGLLERARTRYLGRQAGPQLEVTVTEPGPAVRRWVDALADDLDVEAVAASMSYDDTGLRIRPHRVGLEVDRGRAAAAITAAFAADQESGVRSLTLPVDRDVPETLAEDFDQVLFLDQSEHRLELWLDGRLTHTYTVTTGTGRYPTPAGEFEITAKRPRPTWVNPAPSGWGRGMPRSIGPGPNNPLGLRALNWSVGAIRFHGTADVDNLGRDASHGCVRLANGDIVELYDLVEVGATIISVR